MSTRNVYGVVRIDTSAFRRFGAALRKAATGFDTSLSGRLHAAGEIVAEEARSRASAWSTSIPPTIKVEKNGRRSVSVVAGGAGTPLAGLFELGNTGRHGYGTFRHPIYGRRTTVGGWTNQAMHPFLGPALQARQVEASAAVFKALDDAIEIAATDDRE